MIKKFEGKMDFVSEKEYLAIFIFFIAIIILGSIIGITNFTPQKTPTFKTVIWLLSMVALISISFSLLFYRNKSIRTVTFNFDFIKKKLIIHHADNELFNSDNFLFEGVLANFSAYKSTKVSSFFTLRVFDEKGNEYSYSEEIKPGTNISNIESSETNILEGITAKTLEQHPSFVFEAYNTLLEWSNQPGSQINKKSDNPFEE